MAIIRYSRYPHGTHDIPHGTHDIPHGTHDIPHGTEHPHNTEHPPRYCTHIIQGDSNIAKCINRKFKDDIKNGRSLLTVNFLSLPLIHILDEVIINQEYLLG